MRMEKTLSSIEDERKELITLAQKLSSPPEYDEFVSSTKDSSLKRVSSLLRRLKAISNEPIQQLVKDVQQVNFSMHYAEVCSSILENRPKNSLEYMNILRVLLHLMIEAGVEFRNMFYREILKNVSTLTQTELIPSEKTNFSSFRFLFRLSCELQIIHPSDTNLLGLTSTLKKLLSQEESKAVEFIPFAVYLLKNLNDHLQAILNFNNQFFDKIYQIIVDYFKTMCRYSLRLLVEYKRVEKAARIFYEQKADLSAEFESDLIEAFQKFSSIKTALAGFSDLILLPLPNYENSEPQFVIEDSKVIFTSKIEVEAEIYQDDEERDFYEKLPTTSTTEDVFLDIPEEWKTSVELEEISKDEVNPDTITTSQKIPKGMEQFFKQVEAILSIEQVDKLSEKVNSLGKDFKIEPYFEMFFEVARRKPELVRYISRMIATIKSTHPKLIQSMILSMCGQFHFLTKMKEPVLKTRRRICSFISEFTKFKLLPQSIAFNCLKKCLRDFSGTSIDMTCFLLEMCGRFLYLQPESHARMKHLIGKIGNFRKSSFTITNDKNIMLGYAIYCVIKIHTQNFIIEPDFMETFITFAFSRSSSSQDFIDLITSIQSDTDVKTLISSIAQTAGLEPRNFDDLAMALSSLKTRHSEFIYKTIDMLLSESISDIKKFDRFNFQKALKRIQLIGIFYYRKLIDSNTFFPYLYQAITLGHFEHEEKGFGAYFVDGPEDMSRTRLLLTLLATLRNLRFDSEFHSYIHEFMAMFRCYLASKTELSTEIFDQAIDVFKGFDDSPLEPLNLVAALESFSKYPVYNLFIGSLDYLLTKSQETSSRAESAALIEAQKAEKMAQDLLDLDKEMSKIIGQDLETRKLDRHQPQSSEVSLPFSGLLLRNTTKSAKSSPSILLKKKKKSVLKTLNL